MNIWNEEIECYSYLKIYLKQNVFNQPILTVYCRTPSYYQSESVDEHWNRKY